MQKPDIKDNPSSHLRYDVTVRIDQPPGPFDRIEGTADYRVSNDACVRLTPISGVTITPSRRIPRVLDPVGENVYRGELVADRLLDEDYFGKGVCHWSLVAAGVEAHIGKMDFAASLPMKDIAGHRPAVHY